ncbi:hypothetical protein CHUAL_002527 [Chamberlinius hualienensis]
MKFLSSIVIPDWLLIVGIILTLIYWYLTWNFNYWEKQGIQCPPNLIFLGNLLTERNKILREEDIRKAKRYGTVYGFYEGRKPTIRIADPDMLREILSKQFDHFTDRRKLDLGNADPVTKKFLTLVNGAEWKQIRNVMTPTFTSVKLKQMAPLIEESVAELVEILKEKSKNKISVDLKTQFGPLILDIIASCAFGVKINSQKNPDTTFVQNVRRLHVKRNLFKVFMLFTLPAFVRNMFNLTPVMNQEALDYFKSTINEVISSRKQNNIIRNDFLHLMMEALKGNAAEENDQKQVLTSSGVIAQSILFLLAGFETISTALAIACYQLALNKDIQSKLSNEIDQAFKDGQSKISYDQLFSLNYLDMVMNESLRWFPPQFRTERECVSDAQVGYLTIQKGTIVSIPIHAIHWDEKNYPNPEKFDPERFNPDNKKAINPYTYLPFGIGPRNCIGMRFALMEAKYILAHLIHQFKFVECPETKVPLQFSLNMGSIGSQAGAWIRFEEKQLIPKI